MLRSKRVLYTNENAGFLHNDDVNRFFDDLLATEEVSVSHPSLRMSRATRLDAQPGGSQSV